MVTVQLALVTVEGETRERPVMFLPAGTSDDDRREVDRWRSAVWTRDGYTAIAREAA